MASLSDAQAGERIRVLERQREEAAAAASEQRAALARESEETLVPSIGARFRSGASHVDEEFTRRTTGLVTAEQFRQQKRQLLDEIADAAQHARRALAEEFVGTTVQLQQHPDTNTRDTGRRSEDRSSRPTVPRGARRPAHSRLRSMMTTTRRRTRERKGKREKRRRRQRR